MEFQIRIDRTMITSELSCGVLQVVHARIGQPHDEFLPQPCVDDTTASPYSMVGRRRIVASPLRITSVKTEIPLEHESHHRSPVHSARLKHCPEACSTSARRQSLDKYLVNKAFVLREHDFCIAGSTSPFSSCMGPEEMDSAFRISIRDRIYVGISDLLPIMAPLVLIYCGADDHWRVD
ncbi:uncharacterized protein K489DRAFT_98720 [Dissoconium aciculare CBS 342.82]|uniref:Uncharacterized protein n=1 Tax=Dissoconium aciculare CBS 342.82 TaxID=1314786 RepID=A0A6J3MDW1_9PEZI|nr:uncharacterized protein K489DRAFT_98720 [Dissoconium aciculare CBS 342.82]KAF1825794.1 hypothetical protein K489DRAFT_98720 [Dissoconium aciculare CBS 342.82]